MALTPSSMLPLGSIAPDFNLLEPLTGSYHSLSGLKGTQGTVVMFTCNHCPFVKHILQAAIKLAAAFKSKGIETIWISANDINGYPDDAPEKMVEIAALPECPTYLYDATQTVAKRYQATCTPDLFVFDANLACVYRGRFDESTPGNGVPVTGQDLKDALSALAEGREVSAMQHPSVGCNIKWFSACIFCDIVDGKIPAKVVYEDERFIAFHDIAPKADRHGLLVPKTHIVSLETTSAIAHQALLGEMLLVVPKVAKALGLVNGFRTIINTGDDGGQEVPHLHVHILGPVSTLKQG